MRGGGGEEEKRKEKTSIATGICVTPHPQPQTHSLCESTHTVSSIYVSDFIYVSLFILLVSRAQQ